MCSKAQFFEDDFLLDVTGTILMIIFQSLFKYVCSKAQCWYGCWCCKVKDAEELLMMADDELKEFITSRGMKVSDNQPLLPQAEELLESQVIYLIYFLFQ